MEWLPFLPAFATLGALAFVVNVAAALVVRVPRLRPGESARLLDHLRELQARLLSVVLAVAVLVLLFFTLGVRRVGTPWGFALPLPWPSDTMSVAALGFRALADAFVPPGVALVVTSPLDGVVSLIVVALALTAFAAAPIVAWHTALFLGPALERGEARAALVAVPLALALFLAGAAFGWVVIVPTIFATLYRYAGVLDATLFLTVDSLVSFSAVMLLVFGVAFELPVVMAALSRVGVVRPRTWATGWRHAVLAIVIVAAIVTPDPTVVSQLLVALPMLGLYVVGVGAAFALGGRSVTREVPRERS